MTKPFLTGAQKAHTALKAVQASRAAVEVASRALEAAERALTKELGMEPTERDPSLFDGINFNAAGIARVKEYWTNGVSAVQVSKELKVAKSAIYYHFAKFGVEAKKAA